MGKLLVDGVDVMTRIGTPYPSSDSRSKHTVIGTKIKGLSSDLDNGTKKCATGWYDDCFEGKINKYGLAVTCAPQGTRPINEKVRLQLFLYKFYQILKQ